MILDLGRLCIESSPNLRDDVVEFYDEYKLFLSDITAQITDSFLVEKFSIILNMKLRKIDSETLTNVM